MRLFVARFVLAFSLAAVALATFQGCRKEEEPITSAQELTEFLEDEASEQHIPALAALVFDNDKVLYEKYLGEANRAQQTALTNNHVFLMASISKTITATALLRLFDEGHFSMGDPINNYLPFEVEVPGHTTPITFRMLLTHTSGIADGSALDNEYYYGQDSPKALDAFLESYLVPGGSDYNASENYHDFQPGTEHEYSNIGSALIAVLVEQISGMDFSTYCHQQIFEPLGMEHTFWHLSEVDKPIAVPYDYVGGSYTAYDHYTNTDYPNGGLRSNVRDMHRFIQALINAGSYNGYQLLEASTVSSMLQPQIPEIDSEVGLHFFRMNADHELWGHDGGEQGVATIMAWNQSDNIGAIILANQGEADLDLALEELYLFGREQ